MDFIHQAMKSGFRPDPEIPLDIEPSRAVADLARKRALDLEG